MSGRARRAGSASSPRSRVARVPGTAPARRERVQRRPAVHPGRGPVGGRPGARRGRLRARVPAGQGRRSPGTDGARRARSTSARPSTGSSARPVAFGRTTAHAGALPRRLGAPPRRIVQAVHRLHPVARRRVAQHDRDQADAGRPAARPRGAGSCKLNPGFQTTVTLVLPGRRVARRQLERDGVRHSRGRRRPASRRRSR